MQRGKRGLLWVRVSEDKGQTVDGQERELRQLADRLGVEVTRVIRVEGESVFKGDPPQKADVYALARRRGFDVLLVWSLDRWARRRRDGAREVFEVLPAFGVTVVSQQEPWLSTESIPAVFREVLGQLILWLAEEESGRKSERVKLRYRTNRNRAASVGAKARWGRGHVPSLEEVAAVRAAAARGLSLRAVERETGVPRSTVHKLLRERVSDRHRGQRIGR